MNLNDLIKTGSDITVSVSINDLRDWHKEVIEDTKKQLEEKVINDKAEKYLSRNQVCEILSIDPSTLWRWNEREYLVPSKIGGKRRYKMSDINKLLNNGRSSND